MAIKLSDLYIGNFPITQQFGERPEYYSKFGLKGHEGQDLGMPNGTPLICPFEEAIIVRTVISNYGAYGKHIVLWDPVQKVAVWYCHCQKLTRAVGNVVYRGNLVAYSNNTGNSTGPHLHWSVCRTDTNGIRLNQNNGYIGMLDCRKVVEWDITNPTKPTKGDNMSDLQKQYDDCRTARDSHWNSLKALEKEFELANKKIDKLIEANGILENKAETDLAKAKLDNEKLLADEKIAFKGELESIEDQYKDDLLDLEEKYKGVKLPKPKPKGFWKKMEKVWEILFS